MVTRLASVNRAALVVGAAVLALALAASVIGFSSSRFDSRQRRLAVVGGDLLVLGCVALFARRRLGDEVVQEALGRAARSIRTVVPDLARAAILMVSVAAVATLYVATARSSGADLFYKPTIGGAVAPPLLHGLYVGVTAGLAYGILRLGMGRLISTLVALAFVSSPIHLNNLVPSIWRDYGKVPFILGILLIMGCLLRLPYHPVRVVALTAVAGVLLGEGVWIRQDLILFVPLLLLLIWGFLPGSLLANVKTKLLATMAFTMMFLPPALAILTEEGGSGPLRALAGFMAPFDVRLGVSSASPVEYDHGYLFLDEFVTVNAFAQAIANSPTRQYVDAADFSLAASRHFWAILTNFPADVLVRAYASIVKVLEIPFAYTEPPIGVEMVAVRAAYHVRGVVLDVLAGSGVFIAATALLLISAHNMRTAVFCFVLVLFLTTYPALQFQGRHYFHAELVTWWALAFVVARGLWVSRWLVTRVGGARIPVRWRGVISRRDRGALQRMAIFASMALLVLGGTLFGLREYQSRRVGALLGDYLAAEREALALVVTPAGADTVLVTSPDVLSRRDGGPVAVEYLRAEFSRAGCDTAALAPVLRYEQAAPPVCDESLYPNVPAAAGGPCRRLDFSRALRIDLSATDTVSVFFPAIWYRHEAGRGGRLPAGETSFRGFDVAQPHAACLRGLYRVKGLERFPLLLTAVIPAGADFSAPYRSLARWPSSAVHASPRRVSDLPADVLGRPVRPVTGDDVAFRDDLVQLSAGGWRIRGYARPQFDPFNYPGSDRTRSRVASVCRPDVNVGLVDTDLLRTKDIWLAKGTYFVASGRLHVGGVTFAVSSPQHGAQCIDVTNPGKFAVVLQVPHDAWYTVGVANNLDMYTSLENRVVVDRAGWVKIDL